MGSLMNGGLCERIFDAAKQHLDARDNPTSPSVVLSREDIRSACLEIPLPPEPKVSDGQVVPVAAPAGMARADANLAQRGERSATDTWNLWFHIDMAEGIRRKGCSCCSTRTAQVSVRLDKREVYCTAARVLSSSSASWQETCIVPFQNESLLHFVVT